MPPLLRSEVGLDNHFELMKFAFGASSLFCFWPQPLLFSFPPCCHISSYLASWPARLAFSQAPVDICPLPLGLSQSRPGPLPHRASRAGREMGSADFPRRRSDSDSFRLRVPSPARLLSPGHTKELRTERTHTGMACSIQLDLWPLQLAFHRMLTSRNILVFVPPKLFTNVKTFFVRGPREDRCSTGFGSWAKVCR